MQRVATRRKADWWDFLLKLSLNGGNAARQSSAVSSEAGAPSAAPALSQFVGNRSLLALKIPPAILLGDRIFLLPYCSIASKITTFHPLNFV